MAGAIYTDNYFNYLHILMKYGAGVLRRRKRATIFIFLEYEKLRFGIVNDKKLKRLLVFVYYKKDEDSKFEPLGQINIHGYYPKQVRKILYEVQKKLRDNIDGYRDRLEQKTIVISRSSNFNYKRKNGFK